MKAFFFILIIFFISCDKKEIDSKTSKTEVKHFNSILELERLANEFGYDTLLTNTIIPCIGINKYDTISCYFYNNKLKSITKIKNGKSNGVRVEFNVDRSYYFVGNYVDGIANGVFIEFKAGNPDSILLMGNRKELFISKYSGDYIIPCNPFEDE